MVSRTCLALSAALLISAGQAASADTFIFKQRITGLTPVEWATTAPSYGDWEDVGAIYDCSNWSPANSAVTVNQPFLQTATDCKQDQIRSVQPREKELYSGKVRNAGYPYEMSQTVSVSTTRDAVGSLETWSPIAPTYTAWTDTHPLYDCTSWSPAGSSKTASGTFAQSAVDCKTDQQRLRQDREQETTTLSLRNMGAPVVETRTLSNQHADRNYTVSLGPWVNSGSLYGCTNWYPSASTINQGQTFTQTATDCEQNQTRLRTESYVDHRTGTAVSAVNTTESRILTAQSSTRSATGTKVTKICYGVAGTHGVMDYYGFYIWIWDGTTLGNSPGPVYDYGGYRYTPGTKPVPNTLLKEICREPL